MRLLFTTQPAYGHFHPLVPLALALRSAGHEVAFAASALFAPIVEATGLRAFAAGLDWLESDKSTVPAELKPKAGSTLEEYFAQQFVVAPAERLARDVVALGRTWRPDVIVHERTEFGGSIAAAAFDIPAVAVQVGSPTLITPALLAAVEAPYNTARAALGLPPDERLAVLGSEVVLSFAPPALHDPSVPLPRNFMSFRPVRLDEPTSARLPTWAAGIGRERPAVYATLGTVFNQPTYELPFFPAVLDGLRSEPLDLIITVGPDVDPASLGHQPSNVHVERYLPQDLLFPKCSVVVCHGGYGTLLAAIQQGIPMIVVPFGADQPINARSVQRLGLGHVIDEEDLTADRLRSAVRSLLDDPSWRGNVRRLRDQAAALPPISDAVRIVERAPSSPDNDKARSAN
jgi:UDP:flavonoid glycosyltransferase YjiC (YdhE family)